MFGVYGNYGNLGNPGSIDSVGGFKYILPEKLK